MTSRKEPISKVIAVEHSLCDSLKRQDQQILENKRFKSNIISIYSSG